MGGRRRRGPRRRGPSGRRALAPPRPNAPHASRSHPFKRGRDELVRDVRGDGELNLGKGARARRRAARRRGRRAGGRGPGPPRAAAGGIRAGAGRHGGGRKGRRGRAAPAVSSGVPGEARRPPPPSVDPPHAPHAPGPAPGKACRQRWRRRGTRRCRRRRRRGPIAEPPPGRAPRSRRCPTGRGRTPPGPGRGTAGRPWGRARAAGESGSGAKNAQQAPAEPRAGTRRRASRRRRPASVACVGVELRRRTCAGGREGAKRVRAAAAPRDAAEARRAAGETPPAPSQVSHGAPLHARAGARARAARAPSGGASARARFRRQNAKEASAPRSRPPNAPVCILHRGAGTVGGGRLRGWFSRSGGCVAPRAPAPPPAATPRGRRPSAASPRFRPPLTVGAPLSGGPAPAPREAAMPRPAPADGPAPRGWPSLRPAVSLKV